MKENVYFFANGMPRLLMSAIIAEELYSGQKKYLILLDQFGYRYDMLLPLVEPLFEEIVSVKLSAKRYSHFDQFLNVYFNSYPKLRKFFKPNSEVVLFGIRSPVQKFIVRHNRRLGNSVMFYAESLAIDRYFHPPRDSGLWQKLLRRLFRRAFEYQHDYDRFLVFNKDVYRESDLYDKLETMFNLYGSASFAKYASLMTDELNLEALSGFDTIFFGQPLSNFDNFISREHEEAMLRKIVGDRKALILPHPNEIIGASNKYDILPEAAVYRTKAPNDLLLWRLQPKVTITYSSTIGVVYAMINPKSENYFYPIRRQHFDMLSKYSEFIPNMKISAEFLLD